MDGWTDGRKGGRREGRVSSGGIAANEWWLGGGLAVGKNEGSDEGGKRRGRQVIRDGRNEGCVQRNMKTVHPG